MKSAARLVRCVAAKHGHLLAGEEHRAVRLDGEHEGALQLQLRLHDILQVSTPSCWRKWLPVVARDVSTWHQHQHQHGTAPPTFQVMPTLVWELVRSAVCATVRCLQCC